MKQVNFLVIGSALLLSACDPSGSIPQGVQVFFSPHGGATSAVVQALNQATNTVLVQAYSFTSAPIARALVEAHRRGLHIEVILDKSQRTEKYSEADFLSHEGVPTMIDGQHAIAHNKIMILDDYVVLTGSFNFTRAAEENNAENFGHQRSRFGQTLCRKLARSRNSLRTLSTPGSAAVAPQQEGLGSWFQVAGCMLKVETVRISISIFLKLCPGAVGIGLHRDENVPGQNQK